MPFVESYLKILQSVINDIKTEYFWFFANFMDLKHIDLDYIPEQHEKNQIHVWYNTHPLGGTNKEGNVFLIPTQALKKQISEVIHWKGQLSPTYFPMLLSKVNARKQRTWASNFRK